MIEYKIIFIKTDLKEVTNEQVYNGAYQVFFKDVYWNIWGVDESNYDLYYHFYVVGVEQTITLNKALLFVDFRIMPLLIKPTFAEYPNFPSVSKTMLLENVQINVGLRF